MSTVTPASRQTRMACSRSSWLARVNAIITRSTRPKVIRSESESSVPEARDAEAAGLVDVVVDVADGVQAELRVALEALHELQGDVAGAEDQRPLPQGGRAVQRDARGGAADPGAGAGDHGGSERADDRARRRPSTVSRPKIGQEISSEVTARRGASPTPLAQERRSSRAYRPQT